MLNLYVVIVKEEKKKYEKKKIKKNIKYKLYIFI